MLQLIATAACVATGTLFVTVFGITGITVWHVESVARLHGSINTESTSRVPSCTEPQANASIRKYPVKDPMLTSSYLESPFTLPAAARSATREPRRALHFRTGTKLPGQRCHCGVRRACIGSDVPTSLFILQRIAPRTPVDVTSGSPNLVTAE